MSSGARVDARTHDGWLPLHSACRWNCSQVAYLLLQSGAAVNSQSEGGLTPLHLALSEGDNADVALLLLSHSGVDVNVRSYAGKTAGDLAVKFHAYERLLQMASDHVNELYPAS